MRFRQDRSKPELREFILLATPDSIHPSSHMVNPIVRAWSHGPVPRADRWRYLEQPFQRPIFPDSFFPTIFECTICNVLYRFKLCGFRSGIEISKYFRTQTISSTVSSPIFTLNRIRSNWDLSRPFQAPDSGRLLMFYKFFDWLWFVVLYWKAIDNKRVNTYSTVSVSCSWSPKQSGYRLLEAWVEQWTHSLLGWDSKMEWI